MERKHICGTQIIHRLLFLKTEATMCISFVSIFLQIKHLFYIVVFITKL